MGGYLYRWGRYKVEKVLLRVEFNAEAYKFGYNYLSGLTSVAAGTSTGYPTGRIYQNPIGLYADDKVYWRPQTWFGTQMEFYREQLYVGRSDYPFWYERTEISGDTAPYDVIYRLYEYSHPVFVEYDIPIIRHWSHETNDPSLLVGKSFFTPTSELPYVYVKHFQFGVESNNRITTDDWEMIQDKASYYDGANWRYNSGRVCWGDYQSPTGSWITWLGGTAYCIGGATYDGVGKIGTYTDRVRWNYLGTTIPNDSYLWYGSGIVIDDDVQKPYQ
jgi:hypothetical protein